MPTKAERYLKLKNIPPFDNIRINFGNKINDDLANVHILVGPNGSGKTTMLKTLFVLGEYGDSVDAESFVRRNSRFFSSIDVKNLELSPDLMKFFLKRPVLFYSPSEKPQTGDYAPNWVCEYAGGTFLSYIQKLERSRDALLANNSKKSEDRLTEPQMEEIKSYIRFTEILERAVKEIYGIDFKYKYKSVDAGYKPFLNGEYLEFEQLSMGFQAIIGLITDLLMRVWDFGKDLPEREKASFTLLLDEIETHTHPQAQRKILPTLQKLFPNAEIICSTHSPFIVNSVSDGWVYELSEENYEKEGEISVLNAKETSIFNSYDLVIDEDFNINDEFGPGAKEKLARLDSLIHSAGERKVEEISSLVQEIKSENNLYLNRRIDFELNRMQLQI